jgi:hypothetical protein
VPVVGSRRVTSLVVPGTANQAPPRARDQNGYLLRWDGEGILFDPGEGTQRQMLQAGVTAGDIIVAEDLRRVPVPRGCESPGDSHPCPVADRRPGGAG